MGLPLDLSRLYDPELLRLAVATIKPPWGDLAFTVVTLISGGRVLLQNYYATSPVITVKIITDPVPSLRGPQSAGKGSG